MFNQRMSNIIYAELLFTRHSASNLVSPIASLVTFPNLVAFTTIQAFPTVEHGLIWSFIFSVRRLTRYLTKECQTLLWNWRKNIWQTPRRAIHQFAIRTFLREIKWKLIVSPKRPECCFLCVQIKFAFINPIWTNLPENMIWICHSQHHRLNNPLCQRLLFIFNVAKRTIETNKISIAQMSIGLILIYFGGRVNPIWPFAEFSRLFQNQSIFLFGLRAGFLCVFFFMRQSYPFPSALSTII